MMNHANENRNKDGRNRGTVLRHAAKKGDLINPRIWIKPAQLPAFKLLIAPLGTHVLGLSAALQYYGLHPLMARPSRSKSKNTAPTPEPSAEPKQADASPVENPKPSAEPKLTDASEPIGPEPSAPSSEAEAIEAPDASKRPKPKAETPIQRNPLFPDYKL